MTQRTKSEKQIEAERVVREGSIEEIAEFFDKTDTSDFDWGEDATEEAASVRREMESVSVRLPKEDVAALKRRAAKSGVGYTTLLRMIVHEHVHSPLTR